MLPRKPRAASSKSLTSENGSAFNVAACWATTEAEASFGNSLGISAAVWVIRVTPLLCLPSTEFQPFELAGVAPRFDVFEVGSRAGGIADIELGRRTRLAALIVVVARSAVGRADHPAEAGQQQLHPAIFGVPGDLDFLCAEHPRMAHHHGNGPRRLCQIMRHVGDEVGALRWLHEE